MQGGCVGGEQGHSGRGAGICVTPASTEEQAQGLLNKPPAGDLRARAELLSPQTLI